MKFENKIREAMASRSLRGLERETGINISQLSQFKAGRGGLSVRSLKKLAVALGLTITCTEQAMDTQTIGRPVNRRLENGGSEN